MRWADNGINDHTINDLVRAEEKNGSLMAQLITELNTLRKRCMKTLHELQKVEAKLGTEVTELGTMQ